MKNLRDRIAFVKQVTGWSNAELARQAVVTRTAPTEWLNGNVNALSSVVAQNLSNKTPFTVNWLATGAKPMYKAEPDVLAQSAWPFDQIDEQKVRALERTEKTKLEVAILAAAGAVDIDIKKI